MLHSEWCVQCQKFWHFWVQNTVLCISIVVKCFRTSMYGHPHCVQCFAFTYLLSLDHLASTSELLDMVTFL